jgi:hypothetical protein
MKRLITLLIICFVAGNVFGTMSRISGMGVESWMLDDDTNVWFSPAQVYRNRNILIGELGLYPVALPTVGPTDVYPGSPANITSQWGGATYRLSKGISILPYSAVVGMFVARAYTGILGGADDNPALSDIDGAGSITGIPAAAPDLRALAPENKFDLFYGLRYTKDLLIGVHLNSASDSMSTNIGATTPALLGDSNTSTSVSSSEMNLNVGVLINKFLVFDKADVVASLNMPVINNTYSQSVVINTGPTEYSTDVRELKTGGVQNIGYAVRGMNKLTEKTKLFTYFEQATADLSNTYNEKLDADGDGILNRDVTEARTTTFSRMQIKAALNIKSSEKTLVILGLGMENNSTVRNAQEKGANAEGATKPIVTEYNWKQTTSEYPLTVGIEHKIKKIITRLGVTRPLMESQKTTINNPDYAGGAVGPRTITTTTTDPQTATVMSLGLGIAIAQYLKMDLVLQQDVLFTGPHLLSGVANTLAGQASIVYKF